MSSERNRLPGGPSNALARRVRSHLNHFGIRPTARGGALWIATWEWANRIACSYAWAKGKHWPVASEIANQYLLLLLVEMKSSYGLRLPYRAADQVPDSVRQFLPATAPPMPLLTMETDKIA